MARGSEIESSATLPVLPDGRNWWVIESERFSYLWDKPFIVFEAAAARSEAEALEHAKIADGRLEAELIRLAVEQHEIRHPNEWRPISRIIRYVGITRVTTEGEIASLDPILLDMLREHEFFMREFEDDAASVIGGGIYEAT